MNLKVNLIKYKCNKCGHEEKPTTIESIFGIINAVIMNFLAAVGIAAIVLFFIVGPNFMVTELTKNTYAPINRQEADDIRDLTIKLTKPCHGDDSDCYSLELYNRLREKVRYVPNSYHRAIYSPLYTYHNGGDCDNLANMYVAMLNTVGIKSQLSCSLEHRHCIAIVPWISRGEKYDKKFAVDLANDFYIMIEYDEDEWNLFEDIA